MSTVQIARVSAGLPTGGQFARTSYCEETAVVLDGAGDQEPADRNPTPDWGSNLDARISTELAAWAAAVPDGDHSIALTKQIDADDHDALVTAHGEHKADWLEGVGFRSALWTRQLPPRPAQWDDPLARGGHLTAEHNGTRFADVNVSDQPGDRRVEVLNHCPAEPDPSGDTEQCQFHGVMGTTHDIRDSHGRLIDGPDGTPAVQLFDNRGVMHTASSVTRDQFGDECRIDRHASGRVVTTRKDQRGRVIDARTGEPAAEILEPNGSGVQTFHGVGLRTVNFPGHATIELELDPPMGGLTQIHRDPDGGSCVSRGRLDPRRRRSAASRIPRPRTGSATSPTARTARRPLSTAAPTAPCPRRRGRKTVAGRRPGTITATVRWPWSSAYPGHDSLRQPPRPDHRPQADGVVRRRDRHRRPRAECRSGSGPRRYGSCQHPLSPTQPHQRL